MKEFKMTLPEGGVLYGRVDSHGNWSCERKGAERWYPAQRDEDMPEPNEHKYWLWVRTPSYSIEEVKELIKSQRGV